MAGIQRGAKPPWEVGPGSVTRVSVVDVDVTPALTQVEGYLADALDAADRAEAAADLATDISGISTSDGVVEALINDDTSDTFAALDTLYGAAALLGGSLPIAVADNFPTNASGTLPAPLAGGAYTVSSSGGQGALGAAVVGNHLVARAPTVGSTNAAYIQQDLGAGKVPKVFTIEFVCDDTGGGAAMISKTMPAIIAGDEWLHMEIHEDAWNLTYITDSPFTLNPIAAGIFVTPLVFGETYRAQWLYDGATSSITLLLPVETTVQLGPTATGETFGTLVTVTDPNIATNIGRYCLIEPWTDSGGTISRFKSWSISADGPYYPTPFVTIQDMARAVAPYAVARPKDLVLTSDVTWTSDATLDTITGLQHTIDEADQLYDIEGELFYDCAVTVGLLFAFAIIGGTAQFGHYTAAALGTSVTNVIGDTQHQAMPLGTPLPVLGTAGATVVLRARITGSFKSDATTAPTYLVPLACQGSSNAATLTIHEGSWMRLTPRNIAI